MLIKKATLGLRMDIPHEPGEWVSIRRLTRRELETAREVSGRKGREQIREMGVDLFAVLQEHQGPSGERKRDPFVDYDLDTILRAGVVGWSYDEPVTDETLSELDAVTAEWAGREILRLCGVLGDQDGAAKNA